MCPICMQSLIESPDSKADSEEPTISLDEHKEHENSQLTQHRVFKTDCNHLFHERCLDEWLKIKEECPSCRRPAINSA